MFAQRMPLFVQARSGEALFNIPASAESGQPKAEREGPRRANAKPPRENAVSRSGRLVIYKHLATRLIYNLLY
jgi:hypothetical protein